MKKIYLAIALLFIPSMAFGNYRVESVRDRLYHQNEVIKA